MLCRTLLLLPIVVLFASSCMSEFCTRHSDCPPAAECGAAGVCVENVVGASDASSDGNSSVSDAAVADATSTIDAGGLPDDAMSATDASAGPDGGTHLLDAGLSPPIDAAPASPDAGSPGGGVVGPPPPTGGTQSPHTGDGQVTEELDAGLAP